MGLFGHLEDTGGRSFKYNIEDVRKKYLDILLSEMGCSLSNKISDNEYVLKTSLSMRYNMNPGKAVLTFTDTGAAVSIKINVAINQTAFARIAAWIEKSLNLLETALVGCKPYEKKTSLVDEINELKKLLDSGLITEDEFIAAKKKILNN